jgi:hypothetical protein
MLSRLPVLGHYTLGCHLPSQPPAASAGKKRRAVPPAVQATLDQQFNASQRAAVTAGLEANARLVLVQGPPGAQQIRTPAPGACSFFRRCSGFLALHVVGLASSVFKRASCGTVSVWSGWLADILMCALHIGAGTGKTKTILGLLSVLACAVSADSPQLLRAAGSGGAAAASSSAAAAMPPTRRDLTGRASPWLIRSAHGLRWLWTPRYSSSDRAAACS